VNREGKIGDKQVFYYKGQAAWEYQIKGIVRLPEQSRTTFDPQIVLLESTTNAHRPLKKGDRELWFPYWIKVGGKWRFGQFPPCFGEDAFLKLLKEAIRQNFFSKTFLETLGNESLREAEK